MIPQVTLYRALKEYDTKKTIKKVLINLDPQTVFKIYFVLIFIVYF